MDDTEGSLELTFLEGGVLHVCIEKEAFLLSAFCYELPFDAEITNHDL